MMNSATEISLAAYMTWLQLALLAVPLIIFMVKMEWQDWKDAHPQSTRQRRAQTGHSFGFHPRPV